MKRIIDGKTYNTETAERIANYWNGFSSNDFSSFDETLYKTIRGNFFIEGTGGPMTHYAVSAGQNTWTGSTKIIPLSEKEAFEWSEKYCNSEIIEKYFSHLIEEA